MGVEGGFGVTSESVIVLLRRGQGGIRRGGDRACMSGQAEVKGENGREWEREALEKWVGAAVTLQDVRG